MMKKLLTCILSIAVLHSIGSAYIYAAESTPSDSGQTMEIEDGINIHYNENAMNGGIDLGVPSSVELTVTVERMIQHNYNPVVSAVMLLNSIGLNTTQQEIADLLGVNSLGIINGEQVTEVLNQKTEGSRYAFTWQQHEALDVADFRKHIVEALAYGNPVLVQTMESLGDSYIEGHKQYGTLYQYGLVKDYFNYGDAVTYTESEYGLYSGFSFGKKAGITSLSYAVGGKGYVW